MATSSVEFMRHSSVQIRGGAPDYQNYLCSCNNVAEVTHRKRRLQGTLEIVASGENHASGALTVALGNGESYQAPFTITSAREAGHVVARYKWFDDFDRDIRSHECQAIGIFSAEYHILSIEGPDDGGYCKTDRIVIELGTGQ